MWSSAGFCGIHLQIRLVCPCSVTLVITWLLTLYNDSQDSLTHRHRPVTSRNLYDVVYRGSLSHFLVRSWCMPPSGRCTVFWGFGKDGACNCRVLFFLPSKNTNCLCYYTMWCTTEHDNGFHLRVVYPCLVHNIELSVTTTIIYIHVCNIYIYR